MADPMPPGGEVPLPPNSRYLGSRITVTQVDGRVTTGRLQAVTETGIELLDAGAESTVPHASIKSVRLDESGPAGPDPWFLSDCEGRLEIWREAVLRNVTRDENGEIDSYRLPAAYKDTDLIASWDLDTWDEGEDPEDDARRRIYAEIVRTHNEGDKAERQEQRVREVIAGAYAREKRLLEWADDVTDEQRETGIRAVALEARSIAQQLENALTRLRDRFSERVPPTRAAAAQTSDATACEHSECEQFREWLSGEKANADKQARQAETDRNSLRTQRDAVLALIGDAHSLAAADIQAGGPSDQLDDLSVPVHDLLIALGVLDQDGTGRTEQKPGDSERRNLVAATIATVMAHRMVICEHTQVIEYGSCGDAVLTALARWDEENDHG